MSTMQPLEVVHAAYAAFGRGDLPGLLELVTEDVEWISPGEGAVPYGGPRKGRAQVAEFFTLLAGTEDVSKFAPQRFVVDGDTVITMVDYAARVKATGKSFEEDLVHIFTVREGKIVRFREHYDSWKAAKNYR